MSALLAVALLALVFGLTAGFALGNVYLLADQREINRQREALLQEARMSASFAQHACDAHRARAEKLDAQLRAMGV